ncbi:MAG: GAF domain-containing protein, partial [Herpetosiphon sp.]|nr:GAF domain-containing protein [Herpetosiphon sp.]
MTQTQRYPTLKRRVADLEQERSQNQRALDALHRIGLVCRGQHNPYTLLEAIYHELKTVWEFDACFMALCDQTDTTHYRLAMMVDQGVIVFGDHDPVGPITGYMIKQRTPLLFNDLVVERTKIGLEAIETFGTEKLSRAWMGVPLLIGAEAFGVVSLQSYRVGVFTPQDLDLLGRVTNSMAIALENALLSHRQTELTRSLEQQISLRNADLFVISEIAAMLIQQQPLPQMFGLALNFILDLMELDAGAIFSYEHDLLRLIVQRGASEHLSLDPFVPNEFLAETLRQRQFELITSPPTSPDDLLHGFEAMTSQIIQPLYSEERVIGMLIVGRREARLQKPAEIELLQVVSNQIALALEHGTILAQQQRQIAELEAISNISSVIIRVLEPDTLLRQLELALRTFLDVDVFYMAIYDPDRHVMTVSLAIEGGAEPLFIRRDTPPRAGSFTEWVINHREPLLLQHVSHDIHSYPTIQRVLFSGVPAETWLGVPMLDNEQRPLGVISLQSYRPHAFDERDLRFMQAVASHISLHVLNVQLFQQRERQLAELDAQQQITELVSSTLDLHQMLRSIDIVLRDFLKADAFQVVICEFERRIIEIAVVLEEGVDVPTSMIGMPIREGTFTDWTYTHRQPLRIANIFTDWNLYKGINPPPPNATPMASWLSVPLIDGESPIGMLAVRAFRPSSFGVRDEQFLLNVGRQLTLSIRNARLFAAEQQAHRTAETLREIARVLNTSFNPDEVLDLILRELKKVIHYDSASTMLPVSGRLRIVARHSDRENDPLGWRDLNFPIDQSNAAGRIMLTRTSAIINDTLVETGWTPSPMKHVVRSWIGVPLISKGVVLGVLNINALKPYAFNARSLEIAQTFADQAATALEHARLYRDSVTRVEQELEIAQRIQSNLFPRTLPKINGVELAALCIPARETGGDFYDVIELSDQRWAIMVGDASGKSIPGAMLMAIARSITRSEARDHETPQVVMRETNRWICHDVPVHAFVALAYATFDTSTNTLALANAGQLDPILVRANGEFQYLTTSGAHFPLGIDPETAYETATFQLGAGDRVVFYTDGVVEAKSASGEMWGFERFEQLVKTYAHQLNPQELMRLVMYEINIFTDNYAQHDDITLVILHIDPHGDVLYTA